MIFVFGSNLAGRHLGGAALEAVRNFGALPNVGAGPMGRAYAIPTMDEFMYSLPLSEIQRHVNDFLGHAVDCPGNEFFVTAIGCGIAGYKPSDIAPMFDDAPENCTLHRRLVDYLNKRKNGDD